MNLVKRIGSICLALLLLTGILPFAVRAEDAHIVINQVYGGSDNGYADHSFIELYNPTGGAVNLAGWSVQYRSSASGPQSGSWAKLDLTGWIDAGGYYLIRCGTASGTTNAIPAGNQEWDIRLHNKGVTVVLVHGTNLLGDDFKGDVSGRTDYVDCAAVQGNDNAASQIPYAYEKSYSPIQSRKKGIRRSGFADTGDNGADFAVVDYSKKVSADKGPHAGTYTGPAAKTAQTLSASVAPAVISVGETAQITAAGAKTALTYQSGDESVLTVDGSGLVTAVGRGTCAVTVTAAEDDTYAAASATASVTVTGAASKTIDWPGSPDVTVFDKTPTFLTDSSGLDFSGGKLYAVDNGTGTFWVLNAAKDGTLTFADGFGPGAAGGKRARFIRDANDASAAGPDAEGITAAGNGFVYIASERDNSDKSVNFNEILKIDPSAAGPDVTALQEWNLTASLPQVTANMGLEGVEWVSASDVNGKLFDQNTNAAFDLSNYPDAEADGVFFAALEANGHVYAYVLNRDGTSVQIADIDSELGGVMDLNYDACEHVLWAAADNGYGNRCAKITLNGSAAPEIVRVRPAAGLNAGGNYEGFAIADADYTVNGRRPVYHFEDGPASGALVTGSIDCDYKAAPAKTEYTVTFDSGEGSSAAAATVEAGSAAAKPADPARPGYDFGGWFTDERCTAAYDFTAAVSGNLTLYAKWTSQTTAAAARETGGAGQDTAAAVQKTSSAVPGSPKTGDSANWVFPASCLILSGALIVLLRKAHKVNRNAGGRVCRFR